jgi:hypothetical protein
MSKGLATALQRAVTVAGGWKMREGRDCENHEEETASQTMEEAAVADVKLHPGASHVAAHVEKEERPLLSAIKRTFGEVCPDGGVMLDIGANAGKCIAFARHMCKHPTPQECMDYWLLSRAAL